MVMVKEAHEWDLFCAAIARPDVRADSRFESSANRRENAAVLIAILDQVFATKTLAEWSTILGQHRVTFGVVQKSEALPTDAQMLANGVFPDIVDFPGQRTVDSPITVEGCTKVPPHAAPALGAHTHEVLRRLGYSDTEIAAITAD